MNYIKIVILFTIFGITGCSVIGDNQPTSFSPEVTYSLESMEMHKKEAISYLRYAQDSKGAEVSIYLSDMERSLHVGKLFYSDIYTNSAIVKRLYMNSYKYEAIQHLKTARNEKGRVLVALSLMEEALDKSGLSYSAIGTSHEEVQRLLLKK